MKLQLVNLSEDANKAEKVKKHNDELSKIPYSYVSVAGKPFEQILKLIKRWIVQEVKTDEKVRQMIALLSMIILKLMSSNLLQTIYKNIKH